MVRGTEEGAPFEAVDLLAAFPDLPGPTCSGT